MEVLIQEENQSGLPEQRLALVSSLVPIESVVPVDSLEVVRDVALFNTVDRRQPSQCCSFFFVIPLKTCAIRINYTLLIKRCTIEVTVECFIVNMVQPSRCLTNDTNQALKWEPTLRICSFSFNWIFCPRCTTGICCEAHQLPSKCEDNWTTQ